MAFGLVGSGEKGQMSNDGKDTSCLTGLIIMVIIEAVAVIMLLIVPELGSDTLRLPLMVLFGIIAFLGALTIAASVLKLYNLANPMEALGLPNGSVRALIALSLILIFALMVIFMANNLRTTSEYTYPVNSTVIYGDKNYTNPNGNITILLEPSAAAIDFSKQVLTTVSTLVVALAGFYFGTRSVAQAQKSTEPPEVSLSISPESPASLNLTGKPDEDKLRIAITTTPENETITYRIKDEKEGTDSGKIERSDNPNEFIYSPPANVKSLIEVTLRFWMNRYPGDVKELIVKVKPKQP